MKKISEIRKDNVENQIIESYKEIGVDIEIEKATPVGIKIVIILGFLVAIFVISTQFVKY